MLEDEYPDIAKEWDEARNSSEGLSIHDISTGSGRKVWWICKNGHSYQCSPYNRCKRHNGCTYCSGKAILAGYNDLATLFPTLLREWDYKKNSELGILPNEIGLSNRRKVWWICKNGHSFDSLIYPRTKGVGCPYCAGKRAVKGVNDFATLHPELLKEWDYDRNAEVGIKPDEMLIGSQKKVYWICEKGHSYGRSIYDKLNGRGHCPFCTNRKVLKGFNDFATKYPGLLKEWNYKKNDELGLKPDEIADSNKKVWWKCEKGHEWSSVIRSRANGCGCPICSNNQILKGFNDLATTNPELLEEWNYEKNKNISPFEISYGSTKKVWWKCKNGHEYCVPVAQKIRQNIKCPICANQQVLKGYNDFATKHPQLLKEWDFEKNDKLGIKPDEIVMGGRQKVWWKCERGHEWQCAINARIRNNKLYNRCPTCSSYLRTSIPEKIIYYYLKKKYPKTIANYKPEWLRPKEIDIFIPELNVGIEYDGYYYHGNSKRDIEKDNLCLAKGINLVRIREKRAKPIITNATVYTIKIDNNRDYSYVGDALSFLSEYLRIDIDYDINRDIDDIISMIDFIEKENCITKTNPEVLKEWDYENNEKLGINPEFFSSGSSMKVWWKCKNGHSYKAVISTKINQGTGCPYCSTPPRKVLTGFNDLATTEPEILKKWDFKKNKVKPTEITRYANKKVWLLCDKGHSYDVTLLNLSDGGCPYCSGHRVLSGFNDLATTNPELLDEWDYEKNEIKPNKVGKGQQRKVWWKCPKGHSYSAAIVNRVKAKSGCPYCSGRKILVGFNDIATIHPQILEVWDYEKNEIKPTEISKGSDKKVWLKCNKGHSYETTIPNYLKGNKCTYCASRKVLRGFNDIATTDPDVLKVWNDKKYSPYELTRKSPRTIACACPKCRHEWTTKVYNLTNQRKCPGCKKSLIDL